ncbi:peptide methionine sulfoxide reductase-like, partial [Dendronephthya gigantea]|uniref:peptide methionine sulfoxide reductase-like n=1 Tax=Dendronephthya gigantea TaxID=151771 RepID=UPI00106BC96F
FPESQFGCVPGILKTRVGYTGGHKKNPTYRSLGDHTETLQVEFDPKVTNYSNLLRVFWDGHDYTQKRSPQYKSAIFYHSEEQKRLAEESSKEEYNKKKKTVATDILPADIFYDAEDYHQKYRLRAHNGILAMLKVNNEELKDSTIAARLNGYLGQNGSKKQFDSEIKTFNVPPDIANAVRKVLF